MHKLNRVLALATFGALVALPASAQNLVVNGNFQDPNAGNSNRYFSSDYTRAQYPGSNQVHGTGPGYFELGSDPQLDNETWTTNGAYDNPGGQFLLVDGSNAGSTDAGAKNQMDGTARVWFESINVKAGWTYDLSAYAEAFDNQNQANLIFTIGGKSGAQVGNNLQLGTPGVWQNMNATWVAPSTETVSFAIVDKETATSGNDFGLDDISFKPVPEAGTVITFAMLFVGGFLVLRKRSQANAAI